MRETFWLDKFGKEFFFTKEEASKAMEQKIVSQLGYYLNMVKEEKTEENEE